MTEKSSNNLSNNLLKGKKGIIVGVANKWSIAWAVAQACMREGAEIGFTYQGERVLRNLDKLFKEANLKDQTLLIIFLLSLHVHFFLKYLQLTVDYQRLIICEKPKVLE